MNIFRLFGDLTHLISIFILMHKMKSSRSCSGISFKSQALYTVVYVTRYLDLIYGKQASLYNTLMKIFFISSSIYILYLMKYKFKPTHDPSIDTFKVEYLLLGSFVMSIVFTHKYTFAEVLWSFSIWLESVAILPQLFMLQRTGEGESLTVHYIFALGIYRALYIPNWIYRWLAEDFVDGIAIFAGIIQTVLYSDFFYIYYTKVMKGKKFELPQ
ncbi:ER lumen protein retaining receptor-domain-containing protein [Dipodascopsis uninucleata]